MVEVVKKVSEKYDENVKAVRKNFPKALVFDVTIEGAMKRLDPNFPIGNVRVPGMKKKGLSVNGVWESLKVFKKKEEIDEKWMADERKVGKMRGCKSWGKLLGIQIGDDVLDLEEGGKIFEKIYREIVEERFGRVIEGLRREAEKRNVVLLDYKEERLRPFNHVEILKEILVA